MENLHPLRFLHFNLYFQIRLQAMRARRRFPDVCGQHGSPVKSSSFEVFHSVLKRRRGMGRLSLSPSIIIRRWIVLPPRSETLFNAEVGHCVPQPRNDSAARPSISMFHWQTTVTVIGRSEVVVVFSSFLCLLWFMNRLIINWFCFKSD